MIKNDKNNEIIKKFESSEDLKMLQNFLFLLHTSKFQFYHVFNAIIYKIRKILIFLQLIFSVFL